MAGTATSTPEYAIEVNDVTIVFNMASEQLNNLKEYFIKIMRHELFFSEFRALKHILVQGAARRGRRARGHQRLGQVDHA